MNDYYKLRLECFELAVEVCGSGRPHHYLEYAEAFMDFVEKYDSHYSSRYEKRSDQKDSERQVKSDNKD